MVLTIERSTFGLLGFLTVKNAAVLDELRGVIAFTRHRPRLLAVKKAPIADWFVDGSPNALVCGSAVMSLGGTADPSGSAHRKRRPGNPEAFAHTVSPRFRSGLGVTPY